jgi:LacI family transcriptional regulator
MLISLMKRLSISSTEATIRDVARLAEVSIATASYALNDTGRVSAETRAKVLEAAKKLGYEPSMAARLMRGAKGNLIAVLADGLAGPWYGEILEGLQPEAKAAGFAVVAMTIQAESLALCKSLVSSRLVRGLVVLNPSESWAPLLERLAESVPTALFDPGAVEAKAMRFELDNRGGIEALMAHLWGKGYRDYLWLDGDIDAAWDARERFAAFQGFIARVGLPAERARRAHGGFKADVAERSVAELLGRGERPRAIVAANDESAIGALAAIKRFGLKAPGDVAVAGFDGLEASAWVDPPLTTLAYDRNELGRRMARSVMDALDGRLVEMATVVPLELLARGSA